MSVKEKIKNWIDSKRELGITTILTTLVSGLIIAGVLIIGVYSIKVVYDSKSVDLWAIVYLNLENEINELEKKLGEHDYADHSQDLSRSDLSRYPPYAILEYSTKSSRRLKVISGDFGTQYIPNKQKFISKEHVTEEHSFHFWSFGGQDYFYRIVPSKDLARLGLAKVSNKNIVLVWKSDLPKWLYKDRRSNETLSYLATRAGQMVYSSDWRITQESFTERPLVKEFINSPLMMAQFDSENPEGDDIIGIYKEVPGSNLVVFLEAPLAASMRPVEQLAYNFVFFIGAILLLVVLILQLPLRAITTPLKDLVGFSEKVGDGDYTSKIKAHGFGEINVLCNAFNTMTEKLLDNKRAIAAYIEKEKESVRLEAEIEVAKSVQDTLLPHKSIPDMADVELFYEYKAAEECAGDWYGYHYNEETGETIAAVADVSGHGVGSAMFTAVISALFEDTINTYKGEFPAHDMLTRLNQVISEMGQRNWHSTFCLAIHQRGENKVKIVAAGSVPPIFFSKSSEKSKSILTRSSLLGLDAQEVFFDEKILDFEAGDRILLYTDGITEAKNPQDKMYGLKKLKQVFNASGAKQGKLVNNSIINDWTKFRQGVPADDDFCLLIMERKAS